MSIDTSFKVQRAVTALQFSHNNKVKRDDILNSPGSQNDKFSKNKNNISFLGIRNKLVNGLKTTCKIAVIPSGALCITTLYTGNWEAATMFMFITYTLMAASEGILGKLLKFYKKLIISAGKETKALLVKK